MPIKIPDTLPARKILESEGVFVIPQSRAAHQDIRPLRLVILNLMPDKITTETQLLRCLSNTPLQIEIDLLQMSTHTHKNTDASHLADHYTTFDELQKQQKQIDGMIVTGAPIELLPFEDVDYWTELCTVFAWAKAQVQSTLHICWGAQAGLYYHYQIPKETLQQKCSGVFAHRPLTFQSNLLRGFDDSFFAPHSRHTQTHITDLETIPQLRVLAVSDDCGLYLAESLDGREVYVTGHPEYDERTLADEYKRDCDKGMSPALPVGYFPGNDPSCPPVKTWRSHAYLLYANWLNYYVYQETPF